MNNFRDLFYNLNKHSTKWENYFEIYDKHFPQYLNKKPIILEIGIAHGGSTEMFKKYFDDCTIFAVDYDIKFKDVVNDIDVELTLGDQGDPNFWDYYLKDKPNFDIIIDDGGHEMNQQIVTLVKTFPKLNNGGTYLVEDTHTSYWHEWGGGFRKQDTFIEFTKTFVDFLHAPFINDKTPPPALAKIIHNLWSVSYYNSIVVLEKKESLPSIEANNGRPR